MYVYLVYVNVKVIQNNSKQTCSYSGVVGFDKLYSIIGYKKRFIVCVNMGGNPINKQNNWNTWNKNKFSFKDKNEN